MSEFWMPMGVIPPSRIADRARSLQSDGWHGMTLYDSQNLGPETFVSMTSALLATTTLRVNIATSNPVTRHPSVAAAALVTLAEMVGPERLRYGIGRGDASLAYNGGTPATLRLLERYVTAVRRYLERQPVPFGDIEEWRLTRPLEALRVAHAPEAGTLKWPDPGLASPPIDIAATGPRSLALAGRLADRLMLGMGGHVGRVRWGIEQAREARRAGGLDPATLSVAIPVSVAVTDDLDAGRRQVSNLVATAARFAVISGSVVGPTTKAEEAVYRALISSYDLNSHSADQCTALTDDFIDDFAVVGPPQLCVERLLALREAGVDAFQLLPPMEGSVTPVEHERSYRRLVEDVLPEVRRHAGG